MERVRIIVADDYPPFLQELVSLLAVEFDVVATAADGKSALDLISRYQPDLVVLDLQMPELDGMEVTRELAKHSPSTPVVICSVETDPEVVEAVRRAGALAYVFKIRVRKDLTLAVEISGSGADLLCHQNRTERHFFCGPHPSAELAVSLFQSAEEHNLTPVLDCRELAH